MIEAVITCYFESVWKDFLATIEFWNSVSNRLSAALALSHLPGDQKLGPNIMCLPDDEVKCARPVGRLITGLLTSIGDSTFD